MKQLSRYLISRGNDGPTTSLLYHLKDKGGNYPIILTVEVLIGQMPHYPTVREIGKITNLLPYQRRD